MTYKRKRFISSLQARQLVKSQFIIQQTGQIWLKIWFMVQIVSTIVRKEEEKLPVSCCLSGLIVTILSLRSEWNLTMIAAAFLKHAVDFILVIFITFKAEGTPYDSWKRSN